MNMPCRQILNLDTLKKLQHEMEEGFDEVYTAIMESLHGHINELATSQNSKTRLRMLHSLKSPAASLGAEQLAELAAGYEKRAMRHPDVPMDEWITALQSSLAELEQELVRQGFKLP